MPYLRLDLAKTYPSQTKRDLAARLCSLYADVMQTQLWRPNVGIAELGEDNLFRLGADGLEPITMVLVEIRRGPWWCPDSCGNREVAHSSGGKFNHQPAARPGGRRRNAP